MNYTIDNLISKLKSISTIDGGLLPMIAVDDVVNMLEQCELSLQNNTSKPLDCVSRQAVIGMVNDWTYDLCDPEDDWAAIHDVKALPSAQPEITEEQAIEHLQSTGWMQRHDRILTESTWDIIRCRDCKYGRGDIFDRGLWCEKHPSFDPPSDDWFCGSAERRTDG